MTAVVPAGATTPATPIDHAALPARVRGFPWPFLRDAYRYSANVEPALRPVGTAAGSWGGRLVDIDEEYQRELAERDAVLRRDPTRCSILPHMVPATWDAALTLMQAMARDTPGHVSLAPDGPGAWHWRNDLAGLDQRVVPGDEASIGARPLEWIGRQVQDDIVLLDQREGALWGDAGLVTFAADWSMHFDVGMSFLQIHGPVPRVHEEGIMPRAQQFIMRLQVGQVYRRTNWTMTVDRRLDTSTETYPEWGRDRRLLTPAEAGHRLHLRVEVQHLLRLPQTGTIMFLIRTYMLSLAEVSLVPTWRDQLAAVLAELPQDIVDYKGLTRVRDKAVNWLSGAAGASAPG